MAAAGLRAPAGETVPSLRTRTSQGLGLRGWRALFCGRGAGGGGEGAAHLRGSPEQAGETPGRTHRGPHTGSGTGAEGIAEPQLDSEMRQGPRDGPQGHRRRLCYPELTWLLWPPTLSVWRKRGGGALAGLPQPPRSHAPPSLVPPAQTLQVLLCSWSPTFEPFFFYTYARFYLSLSVLR